MKAANSQPLPGLSGGNGFSSQPDPSLSDAEEDSSHPLATTEAIAKTWETQGSQFLSEPSLAPPISSFSERVLSNAATVHQRFHGYGYCIPNSDAGYTVADQSRYGPNYCVSHLDQSFHGYCICVPDPNSPFAVADNTFHGPGICFPDPRVPNADAPPPRHGPGICIPDPNAVSTRGYSEDANSMGNSIDIMQSDAATRTMEPPPSPSGYQRESAPPQQTLVNHDVQTQYPLYGDLTGLNQSGSPQPPQNASLPLRPMSAFHDDRYTKSASTWVSGPSGTAPNADYSNPPPMNTPPATIPTRCPCTLCSSVFKGDSAVDNLKSHMLRMHPVGGKVKYYRCKLTKNGVHCPMETPYPNNRKSHLQTVHDKEFPPNPERNKLDPDLVASMFEEFERPPPTN